jgi:hypothetical protein
MKTSRLWQYGLALAQGDIIILFDGDYVMLSTMVERTATPLALHEAVTNSLDKKSR